MNGIGPTLHSGRPRVVAFGGGKGGSGRSTLCAEIARSMARHNHRILCVDASWECCTLNTLLHTEEPIFDLSDVAPLGHEDSHLADFIVETGHKNIWMVSLASARHAPYVRPKVSADLVLAQLHELDFDWVFLDLPSSIDPLGIGMFVLSDVPVLVSTPEPGSIRTIAQYMRAALYQAVGYHPHAFDVRDDVLETLYLQPLGMTRDTLLRAAPGADARTIAQETLDAFEPYVIVNMGREGAERDLGFVLSHAIYESLGVFPRNLGSVDYEDRRWFFNRRTAGGAAVRGEEALSNDIEALSKQIADLRLVDAKYPRPVPRGADVHPALKIGLNPETGRNEIRQTCRRLWEGYRRETSISLVFQDPERRLQVADQLENVYRKVLTLQSDSSTPEIDRERARTMTPAGIEVKPEPEPEPKPRKPKRDRAKKETADIPKTGEQSPGKLIESLRRQRGMSLQELSLRTHIGMKYLAAIEDADAEILPRPVYLRGYLREIAKIFEVDPDHLIDQYFRFLGKS